VPPPTPFLLQREALEQQMQRSGATFTFSPPTSLYDILFIQVLTSYALFLAFKQIANDQLIASAREALIATKLDVALKVHFFFLFAFLSVYC